MPQKYPQLSVNPLRPGSPYSLDIYPPQPAPHVDDLFRVTNVIQYKDPYRKGLVNICELEPVEDEPLRCPSCDSVLSTQDGYWYCPNTECGQSPETWGSEEIEPVEKKLPVDPWPMG